MRRRAALEVLSGAYLRPGTIEEAVSRLRAERWVVVAGCTDYYCQPAARPLVDAVLDITGIPEARGIVDREEHIRLGPLTTWAEIAAAELPPRFDALKDSDLGDLPVVVAVGALSADDVAAALGAGMARPSGCAQWG